MSDFWLYTDPGHIAALLLPPVINVAPLNVNTVGLTTGSTIGTVTALNSPSSWSINAGDSAGNFSISNAGVVTATATGATNLGGRTGTINLTIQAFGSGGNSSPVTIPVNCSGGSNVIFLTTTGGSTWSVPTDWNSNNNKIGCIGDGAGGGGGSGQTVNDTGGGGGGGGYSETDNLYLTIGANIPFTVNAANPGGAAGANGTNGSGTWFGGVNGSGAAVFANGGIGGLAPVNGGTGGLGGSVTGAIGDIKFAGGAGGAGTEGLSNFAGGGGGAAGPNGAGQGAQAGGGPANLGGQGDNGTGGLGGAQANPGQNGAELTSNPGGAHAGSGGGGGAAGSVTGQPGGLYGAGGGGGIYQNGAGGAGAQGFVAITYKPILAPKATRPAAGTGVGFFVVNNNLYDANGVRFQPRGVNRVHFDTVVSAGVVNSKASVERWVWNTASGGQTAAALVTQMTSENFNNKIISIPTAFTNPTNGAVTSGDTNPATLVAVTNAWVAAAATFKPIERWAMINIANEWGPQAPSTVWQTSYITAVQAMRAAGYLGTLIIDAPGAGQDPPNFATVMSQAAAILAADPQQNLLFSVHVYGVVPAGQSVAILTPLVQTGLPLIFGEFGPGRSMGAGLGFTTLTPGEMIQTSESLGVGWLSWAFDDMQGGIQYSNDTSNAWVWAAQPGSTHQTNQPAGATVGAYATGLATDLTTNGSNVVLGTSPWGASPPGNIPGMCLANLAVPCSIFV